MMNNDRSEIAQGVIEAFMRRTRTEKEDAVADLLCDLMHYCQQSGEDFGARLRTAKANFDEELAEACVFSA